LWDEMITTDLAQEGPKLKIPVYFFFDRYYHTAMRVWNGVSETANEWTQAQRDENMLVHRGGRLEDGLVLEQSGRYPFNQDEKDYLATCRELR
jgi:hypothetical protein